MLQKTAAVESHQGPHAFMMSVRDVRNIKKEIFEIASKFVRRAAIGTWAASDPAASAGLPLHPPSFRHDLRLCSRMTPRDRIGSLRRDGLKGGEPSRGRREVSHGRAEPPGGLVKALRMLCINAVSIAAPIPDSRIVPSADAPLRGAAPAEKAPISRQRANLRALKSGSSPIL
jgi:hypothetical protein